VVNKEGQCFQLTRCALGAKVIHKGAGDEPRVLQVCLLELFNSGDFKLGRRKRVLSESHVRYLPETTGKLKHLLSRSFHVVNAKLARREAFDGGRLGRSPNYVDLRGIFCFRVQGHAADDGVNGVCGQGLFNVVNGVIVDGQDRD
jgi:hypothetical protein